MGAGPSLATGNLGQPCDRPRQPAVFATSPISAMPDPDAFLAALRPLYDDALRTRRAMCSGRSPSQAEDVF